MDKCFTTAGFAYQPKIESGFQGGPSISREEQIRRLSFFKKCKGKSTKQQLEIGEPE